MLSGNDHDTKAPAKTDHERMGEESIALDEKPLAESAQSSISIVCVETLLVWLEIVQLTKNLRLDLSYDKLQFGTDFVNVCRGKMVFYNTVLHQRVASVGRNGWSIR